MTNSDCVRQYGRDDVSFETFYSLQYKLDDENKKVEDLEKQRDDAVMAERERCAKIADKYEKTMSSHSLEKGISIACMNPTFIAAAIRSGESGEGDT
jgi:hypothetical protein